MIHPLRSLVILITFLPSWLAHAQTLHGPTMVKADGIFQGCDSSLTVDMEVTALGDLAQQFDAMVDTPGYTILEYRWFFLTDMPMEAGGPSVQITYPAPGETPVCLAVVALDNNDLSPCSTAVCRFIDVLQHPSCAGYEADFTISSVSENTITFQEQSQYGSDEVTLLWNFDISTATEQTTSHTFDGPGPHEICLTITGPAPEFCTSTVCKWLYLGPGDVECAQLLQPGFMHYQYENLLILVDTTTTTGQEHELTWDLGDGTQVEGPVAVHVYSFDGEHEVCALVDLWGPLVADTCSASLCRTINTGAAVSVEETDRPRLELWPSPANDHIQLRTPFHGPAELMVTDALGRMIRRRSVVPSDVYTVDLAGLHTGSYVLHLITADGVLSGRFVKE